ncbi:protein cramped-like [Glandiceps talaboti]
MTVYKTIRMTTAVSEPATENQDSKASCSSEVAESKVQDSELKRRRGGGETTKEKEENIPQYHHPVLRSSVRPHKRFKKDQSPPPTQPKEPEKPAKQEQQTVKKRWEAWTVQDKNLFFEALFEHGKDFEAIQKYMEVRHKKRGDPPHLIKNKDQVRHLYYRTWHKISKYITPNEELKKTSQELYGLINYGELRKKVGGGLNEKIGLKLNELVTKGATLIRHKSRNLRIKTPICKSLKRLNSTEGNEEEEPIKLPAKVVIELQPQTNAAWATIQSMAQNPRIRITAPLKKEIGSLVGFLQEKWTPSRLKLLRSLRPFLNDEPHAFLTLKVPENTEITPQNNLKGKYLHSNSKTPFMFRHDCGKCGKLSAVSNSPRNSSKTKTQNVRTAKASSSNAKNSMKEVSANDSKGTCIANDKPCENCKKARTGNYANCSKVKDKNYKCVCASTAYKVDNMDVVNHRPKSVSESVDVNSKQTEIIGNNLATGEPVAVTAMEVDCNDTAKIIGVDDSSNSGQSEHTDNMMKDTSETGTELNSKSNCCGHSTELSIEEKLQQGITIKNGDKLTITEIYIMLGMPEKMKFEYSWKKEEQEIKTKVSENQTQGVCGPSVSSPDKQGVNKQDQVSDKTVPNDNSKFVKTIGRLIQLASLELAEVNKPKQSTSTNGSPARSSVVTASTTPPSKSNLSGSKTSGNNRSPKETSKITTPKVQNVSSKAVVAMPNNSAIGKIDKDRDVFLLPTIPIIPKKISPTTLQDKTFMQQLQTINKQPNRRRTRGRKPLVVQRTLLPKSSGQMPTRHMMSLSIIPNSSSAGAGTGSFTPILPSQLSAVTSSAAPSTVRSSATTSTLCSNLKSIVPTTFSNNTTTINTANTLALAAKVAGVPGQMSSVGSPIQISNASSPVSVSGISVTAGVNVTGVTTNMVGSTQPTMNGPTGNLLVTPQSVATIANIQVSSGKPLMSTSTISTATSLRPIVSSKSIPVTTGLTINTTEASTVSETPHPLLVSPPNMSSFLDISLPPPDGGMLSTQGVVDTTELIDIAMGSSGIHSFDGHIATSVTTSHKTGSNTYLTTPPSPKDRSGTSPLISPSTSPFKLLTSSEHQWLNGERDDISFSSILAGIESPEKKDRSNPSSGDGNSNGLHLPTPSLVSECSRDSLMIKHAADVDSTLQYMMNENSVDYISKFADLAAQISATPETPKKVIFDLHRLANEENSREISSVVKNLDKLE